MGASVVQAWRNSLKARPPPCTKEDPYYPGNDRRYDDLSEDQLPLTESLLDTMKRTIPLWEYKIKRDISNGNNVLVVGHGNTLRGLIKVIDDVSDVDIQEINLPRGIPVVYNFDKRLKPLPAGKKLSQIHTNAIFLEKPGLLEEALQQQDKWKAMVPGLDEEKVRPRDQNMVDALEQLKAEQNAEIAITSPGGRPARGSGTTEIQLHEAWDDDPSEFEDWDEFSDEDFGERIGSSFFNWVPASSTQLETAMAPPFKDTDPVVVFIRHGRTPHNNLGLFTGWEDPPLAPDGVEDAKRAGRVLRQHGFQFDVMYTSWLHRAIQTGVYVLDELDCTWLPIIKSWRLNERMVSMKDIEPVKLFCLCIPERLTISVFAVGNDFRRIKYVKDLRVSWTETLNRSIEQRKLRIHRKFPKSEKRLLTARRPFAQIPFYTERITHEAINRGKRVLITSHENALRGILMHLCSIPEEAMNQLHIPNGVPLVYNVKAKCITLLEDKDADEQISIEDFGPAAKYLFRPCELDDEFFQNIERIAATSPPPNRQEESREKKIAASTQDPIETSTPPIQLEEDIEVISDGSSSSSDSSSPPPPSTNSSSPETQLAP
ncbi:MAG: hypothetical protein SGILL_004656 [Bacillariaceae sp.]